MQLITSLFINILPKTRKVTHKLSVPIKANPYLIFVLLLFYLNFAYSQKPAVDSISIRSWETIESPVLSHNGLYMWYTINNRPAGAKSLVVQSVDTSWKKTVINGSGLFFTNDNMQVVIKCEDTLYLLGLGTNKVESVANVVSYKMPYKSHRWIAYQVRNSPKELILLDVISGISRKILDVVDYSFGSDGKFLVLKKEVEKGDMLQLVTLADGKIDIIWPDINFLIDESRVNGYCFSDDGSQLAFMVQKRMRYPYSNTVWYINLQAKHVKMLVDEDKNGIEPGFSYNDLHFNGNGKWIYFRGHISTDTSQKYAYGSKVDVWSYHDSVLQSEQLTNNNTQSEGILYAVNIESKQKLQLLKKHETIVTEGPGDYIVISDNGNRSSHWWKHSQESYYLLSLKKEMPKLLTTGISISYSFLFSPSGRYVIYFDQKHKNYYCFDILLEKAYCVSPNNSIRWEDKDALTNSGETFPVGIAGWLKNEQGVLIYDHYDIWCVDPTGKKPPYNITNNFGRLNSTKLRIVNSESINNEIGENDSILLVAFNVVNKYNGFYRAVINKRENPQLLSIGPYLTYHHMSFFLHEEDAGMEPIKARNADVWIVKRQTASNAPNFYVTKDFITYTPLTDIQPHKRYNWLTAELVQWKQFDGKISQGILYKPENFNPSNNYPIIFNYYERMSNRIYDFLEANFCKDNINIPWFVSRGYLVFTPDIHFSIARKSGKINGEHAYNSIVSAASYLSKMKWLDKAKMGLQGHSFGGQETNYLISHTKLFAAASEAAGTSDFVSTYLSLAWPLGNNGVDRQNLTEQSQGRMGVTLWERPDLYLKASPVLRADKMNTPLLIMHNKADAAVPWQQGVEMFMALRRLGKKAWMLQYDNGGHSVTGSDAIDYTIRLTQFFDHYLKGYPPPKWMTKGVPATLKGIEARYDLDPAGNCGSQENKCNVCSKWNEQYRKTPEMFFKPSGEWYLDKYPVQKQTQLPKATGIQRLKF